MRRSHASQSPRSRKKDMIKVNEPIVEFVTQSSPKNGYSSEEPEEDPEELEEDSELEPEEDPEEDPEEEVEEEPEEDPDEDPSEEYVSEPSSESDTDHNRSNDKKRSVDATAFGSTPCQVNQPQKKTRYEDVQSKSGKQRRSRWDPQPEQDSGSSGKRRRSRWDTRPEQDGETGGGDGSSKRRKTRWASDDDSRLKMLGPLQLPDFKKDFVGSQLDPEGLSLQARLFEINKKLQRSDLHDDRSEGERSPSPQPICNNLSIRINTRDARIRQKLMEERQLIISKLIKKNPTFKTPPENVPSKLSKKVYIPVKEYPDYNFVGLIIGPRGNTQKRMEKETGARIVLRGKGSAKVPKKSNPSDNDDLHVYVEAGDQNSLDAAVAMVEKLLIPLERNEHKRAQLEELARLRATLTDEICHMCKEKDHKAYACPQRPSGLHAIQCDKCGSVRHPTASCSASSSTKQKPNKETDDAKLYVGYLPHSVDDNRLRELFSPFGKIVASRVIMDRITGSSKGYGFVNFESPVEAAGAMMHMNGYQMDGKMLAVRVAGRPPVTGPTATSPSVPSQMAWVGLPRPLLPGAQPSFPNSQGVAVRPAFVFPVHGSHLPNFGAPPFPPPAVVSSLGESMNAFSSPSLVAQFPGDPDYPSSVVSSLGKSMSTFSSPSSVPQFPGDPDYPGSEFKQYFASPTLGPSPPMHFNQMPATPPKPTSWASSQFPR